MCFHSQYVILNHHSEFPKKYGSFSQVSHQEKAIFPPFGQLIVLKTLDIEEEMDPVRAIHKNSQVV
jgi:hypothetical protein